MLVHGWLADFLRSFRCTLYFMRFICRSSSSCCGYRYSLKFQVPPCFFIKAGLSLSNLLRACLSSAVERDYRTIKIERGCSTHGEALGKNAASCPGEFTLVGMLGNSDRYPGFFCCGCNGFCIERASPGWKVEGEHNIARVRINAAPVEIGGGTKILLDDTQYPILIRTLNLFFFFKSFAPLGGETIECETFSFKDRALLCKEPRVLVKEFCQRHPIFQRLWYETSYLTQVPQRIQRFFVTGLSQATSRDGPANPPHRFNQLSKIERGFLIRVLYFLGSGTSCLKNGGERKACTFL